MQYHHPDNIDGVFRIIDYSVTTHNENTMKLTIHALNISGHDIAKGKSDIHPLIQYKDGQGFSNDSYIKPVNPPIEAVKAGEEVTVIQKFDKENVAYIITVAREFN
jgi:hypothetical protein